MKSHQTLQLSYLTPMWRAPKVSETARVTPRQWAASDSFFRAVCNSFSHLQETGARSETFVFLSLAGWLSRNTAPSRLNPWALFSILLSSKTWMRADKQHGMVRNQDKVALKFHPKLTWWFHLTPAEFLKQHALLPLPGRTPITSLFLKCIFTSVTHAKTN